MWLWNIYVREAVVEFFGKKGLRTAMRARRDEWAPRFCTCRHRAWYLPTERKLSQLFFDTRMCRNGHNF